MIRITHYCSTSIFYIAEDGAVRHTTLSEPFNDHEVPEAHRDRAAKAGLVKDFGSEVLDIERGRPFVRNYVANKQR